jgi:hypothetical protein
MDECTTIRTVVFTEFAWRVDSAFGLAGLKTILEAGRALTWFIDGIQPGRGNTWVLAHSADTRFHCGGLPQRVVTRVKGGSATSVVLPFRDIWLAPDFHQSPFAVQHVLHELAHVIDNRSRRGCLPAIWIGGGWGDALVEALGGHPKGLRWNNGTCGLPPPALWSMAVNLGYGNHSSADYFGEAFSWTVVKPGYCPAPQVSMLIRDLVQTTPP